MVMSINDLDDDDILIGELDDTQQSIPSNTSNEGNGGDIMSDFLKSRGIDDPSNILFEDDNGQIESRNWNDLSREEQLNILNTPLEEPQQQLITENNELDDDEIELLNLIRLSGLSPSDYIKLLLSPQEPIYKIDDLSDDSLYILDLESRVGELTDEEAAEALNAAKLNEDFFKRLVEGIRKEYKEKEDYQLLLADAEAEQEKLENQLQWREQVFDVIENFDTIGNLDLNLTNEDKNELAGFMTGIDTDGNNYLYNALLDPETLVKVAWFILNGEEAFLEISDYFKNEIKMASEYHYNRGLLEAKNNNGSPKKPEIFIDNSKKTVHRTYKSIEELDDDE